MPKGLPKIGTGALKDREARKELAQPMPSPEVLGHIATDSKLLNPEPDSSQDGVSWTREDGSVITMVEPPPPWEVGDESGYTPSDARRFVEVPPQWRLHWVNPRLLNSEGWRDWQPVMASDHRVKVRVPTMVSPENYIRRGASDGDILCYMWMSWYEAKKRKQFEDTQRQGRDAVEKQEALAEEMRRGKFGPYIRPEGHQHPRFTNADGRSMRDA